MADKDKKSNKKDTIDDGRTIANMDIDGMPGHIPQRVRKKVGKKQSEWAKLQLTRKERRAMFWGAVMAVLPWVLIYGAAFFTLLLLLDYFWLRG